MFPSVVWEGHGGAYRHAPGRAQQAPCYLDVLRSPGLGKRVSEALAENPAPAHEVTCRGYVRELVDLVRLVSV